MNGFKHDLIKLLVSDKRFSAITEYCSIEHPDRHQVVVSEYTGSDVRLLKQDEKIHIICPQNMSVVQENAVVQAIENGTIFDDAETVDNSAKYISLTTIPHNAIVNGGKVPPKKINIALSCVIGRMDDNGRCPVDDADMTNGYNCCKDMLLHKTNNTEVNDIVDNYIDNKDHMSIEKSLRYDINRIQDEIDSIEDIDADDAVTDDDWDYLDMTEPESDVNDDVSDDSDDCYSESFWEVDDECDGTFTTKLSVSVASWMEKCYNLWKTIPDEVWSSNVLGVDIINNTDDNWHLAVTTPELFKDLLNETIRCCNAITFIVIDFDKLSDDRKRIHEGTPFDHDELLKFVDEIKVLSSQIMSSALYTGSYTADKQMNKEELKTVNDTHEIGIIFCSFVYDWISKYSKYFLRHMQECVNIAESHNAFQEATDMISNEYKEYQEGFFSRIKDWFNKKRQEGMDRSQSSEKEHTTPQPPSCPEYDITKTVLEKIKRDTAIDCAGIEISRISPDSVKSTDSVIGGKPPYAEKIPSRNGKELRFLAQVNCSELPELKGYPNKGLLQFWISNDIVDDEECEVIYYENPTNNRIDQLEIDMNMYDNEDDNWPMKPGSVVKMTFKKMPESMSIEDYRFDNLFVEAYNEIAKNTEGVEEIKAFHEIKKEVWAYIGKHTDLLSGGYGNKIGGYPHFCQWDPRESEKSEELLLLQLDSDDNGVIMWGDFGTANFFIKEQDLINHKFGNCMFHWDCY